jgi:serine/threonine-protein kinase
LRLTQTNMTPGTPHYMAPEQLRGEPVDGRTDVYALGVVAYELLTGNPPYSGKNPFEIALAHLHGHASPIQGLRSDIPPELDTLVLTMLARHAGARPTLDTVKRVCASMRDENHEDLFPEIEIEFELEPVDVAV